MKKIIALIICIMVIIASLVGCTPTEQVKIYPYEFNSYDDLVAVEWKSFKGKIDVCTDSKYVTKGDSCLKIDIDNVFVSGQSAITYTQNQQIMPQFIFQLSEFGNIESNQIGQFCLDIFNACDRNIEIVFMLYDKTSANIAYSDVRKVYAGRINYLVYDVPQLFFYDYQSKITEVIIAVNDVKINDGVTIYMDNVRLIERKSENLKVNKTFKEKEILSFEGISDMQYVMSKNIPIKYVVHPTITSYISYYAGNGKYQKPSLKLSTLGTDGFVVATPDSFKKDEQGAGFTVLPELFSELPIDSCKEFCFEVYNDSPSPRVITVYAEDVIGESVTYETSIDAYQEKTVKVRSFSKLDIQRLTKCEIINIIMPELLNKNGI